MDIVVVHFVNEGMLAAFKAGKTPLTVEAEGFQEYLEATPEVEDAPTRVQDAAGWRTHSSKSQ